ncbi:MAG: response regulator [Verrucomicrobiota bacterium]
MDPLRAESSESAEPATVLVVDDEDSNLHLMEVILSTYGYDVNLAKTGQAALDVVPEIRPDVILLDVMMPGMDGMEVCRRLKEDPDTRHIPIIIVSALTDRTNHIRGIDAGANDFITKPVDGRNVSLRVRNAIRTKKLHDRMRLQVEELRRLEEAKEGMTRMVVHDMRSPLLGLSGNLELALLQTKETPEVHNFLQTAHGQTHRLVEMVNSLLDVSRMEKNTLPLSIKSVNPETLAEGAVSQLGSLTKGRKIILSSQLDPAYRHPCDPELMQRVLQNLIGNAIKYGARQEAHIEVRFRADRGGLTTEVADNGPGIPAADLEPIFDPFNQGSQKAAHSSGLGLTFCKLAIEAHGGTIAIKSPPGEGTTVVCGLPHRKAETHSIEGPQPPAQPSAAPAPNPFPGQG